MPYEGYKGGGYDRSTVIRPPYYKRQLPTMSTSEQIDMLAPVPASLHSGFMPVRRYESEMTDACGRRFSTIRSAVPYSEYPRSLMYGQFRGNAIAKPPTPVGMTSSQVVGAFWLVDGKMRPNTAPPT